MSEFLDGDGEIRRHGGKLPHWQQGTVMQFVTFRLGDSLPAEELTVLKEEKEVWRKLNPEPWDEETRVEYHRRFTARLEEWLDQGHGSCLFRGESNRKIFAEVLGHDDGGRVEHHAWVIMPNHVHLLFTPHYPLEKLIAAWKSISARRIGKGSVWQRDYRDTLIRDSRHFANVVRYIRRNPVKLPQGTFTSWESERALAIS